MRRGSGSPAISLFVLVVLLVITSCPRLALCIGADGHLAVEPVGAVCCQSGGIDPSAGRDPGCPPDCTDRPLLGVWAASRAPLDSSLAAAAASVAMPAPTADLIACGRLQAFLRSPSASPPLPAPRVLLTTVVLC